MVWHLTHSSKCVGVVTAAARLPCSFFSEQPWLLLTVWDQESVLHANDLVLAWTVQRVTREHASR